MKKETNKTEIKYYSLNSILKKNADYNIIFGERSNGKTYAALSYAIEQYLKTGKQTAYIRRWQADFYAKRSESLFNNHCANGYLETVSNGLYNTVIYSQRKKQRQAKHRFVMLFAYQNRNTIKVQVFQTLTQLYLMSF